MESKTLQGVRDELVLDRPGQHYIENTTVDYQKLSDKEVLRITGPLGADFTVKVSADINAHLFFFQATAASICHHLVKNLRNFRIVHLFYFRLDGCLAGDLRKDRSHIFSKYCFVLPRWNRVWHIWLSLWEHSLTSMHSLLLSLTSIFIQAPA